MSITGESLYGFDHKMTPIFIMDDIWPKETSFLPYIQMYFMYTQTRRTISIIMSAVVTADKEITLGDLNFLLFISLCFLKFL